MGNRVNLIENLKFHVMSGSTVDDDDQRRATTSMTPTSTTTRPKAIILNPFREYRVHTIQSMFDFCVCGHNWRLISCGFQLRPYNKSIKFGGGQAGHSMTCLLPYDSAACQIGYGQWRSGTGSHATILRSANRASQVVDETRSKSNDRSKACHNCVILEFMAGRRGRHFFGFSFERAQLSDNQITG